MKIHTIIGVVDGMRFAALFCTKGCVEVSLRDEVAGLRRLWVNPADRRKGIGTALMLEAFRVAREAGKIAISWTVRKDNVASIALAAKLQARPVYDDVDEWWFSLPLQ